MRLWAILLLAVTLGGTAQPAQANCLIIDQLDKIHILQSRLAQNPDTGLFSSDIRQLRTLSRALSNSDVVSAVDGNALMGRGAGFVQFLSHTQVLLQGASVDDPQSVASHFNRARRQTLQSIGSYLTDLRCTNEQVAVARAEAAAEAIRANPDTNTDTEDLQDVADALSRVAEEVLQLRSAVILLAAGAAAMILTPMIRRWMILRRRRAKRHNTTYPTNYRNGDTVVSGMLLDINCFGTKLRHGAPTPQAQGMKIFVQIADAWAQGTVIWSNAHYSGIQFSRAITMGQVHQVLQVDTASTPTAQQKTAP